MERRARFSRRRLIQLAGLLPFGALLAACSGDDDDPDTTAAEAAGRPLPQTDARNQDALEPLI